MKVINRETSKHYNWKEVCDGWHFIDTDELSVIAEKMPPHTAEDKHFHYHSRQFFYILSGKVVMKFENQDIELKTGTGIEIEPHEIHQMTNVSDEPVEFMVISMPKSHGDKEIV